MKKHAYLITAYDNIYVLEKTIRLLDNEKNDIFVHCDEKMGNINEFIHKIQATTVSEIVFINRKSICWGEYSYTDVILSLLDVAIKKEYFYYHLITGTSMPIKTQKHIHTFFETEANEKLYFHINYDASPIIQERVKAYYPLISTKYYRDHKWFKALSLIFGKMQIAFGINRLRKSEFNSIYNGWGWFSIPHDFAVYCVSKRDAIEKTFKYTLASDEVWIHTVAMHSDFKDRVYGYNGKDDPIDASKHFQDWKRGKPYIFTKEDFDLLMKNNPAFWARKFDENKDKEIIDMIYETVMQEQTKENIG